MNRRDSNDPKLLNLKQEENAVKGGISLLNYNGTLIDNQQAIANMFNNSFSTVAEEIMVGKSK